MDAHAHSPAAHPPNHHAHHQPFRGPTGVALALAMAARGGDRARLAVTLTGAGPGDTVVDLGCGPGTAVRRAARLGATAIGVDPARVMRRVATALSLGRSRGRYVDGSAEAIPLDDATATVVWSIATVHHWQDIDAGLAETRRVLRPGGRFLAAERHSPPDAQGLHSHGWTPEQAEAFAEACRAHGFVDIRVEEHHLDHLDVLAVLAIAPPA
jgi:ubiquinone/menaquinone biosynthesis C-methylase UbiE